MSPSESRTPRKLQGPNNTQRAQGMLQMFGENARKYKFLYNPTEIEEEGSVKWRLTDHPGQYLPVASFIRIGEHRTTFELFLYARRLDGGTRVVTLSQEIARVQAFTLPGNALRVGAPQAVSPGRTYLVLGNNSQGGVVESVNVTHKMFNEQLRTIVATVRVQFVQTSGGLAKDVAFLNRQRGLADWAQSRLVGRS